MLKLPKTAHRLLADAVRTHLESDTEEAMALSAVALEQAYRAYVVAEAAAFGTNSNALAKAGVQAIDDGDYALARTALVSLLMVADYAPLADVSQIAPPDEEAPGG